MPWWAWLTVGALLLVAELSFVDFEFFLVFVGLAALLVGLADLAGVELPYWGQWLAFAGLTVVSLLGFRERLYAQLRPPPELEIAEGVEGDQARANEAIEPGAIGTVELRGSRWSARNDGDRAIAAGSHCWVARAEGTRLSVYPQDTD